MSTYNLRTESTMFYQLLVNMSAHQRLKNSLPIALQKKMCVFFERLWKTLKKDFIQRRGIN
ncbi:hypothetical protein BH11VER1_BH11VER1_23930 [soil metagenome]